MMIKFNDATIVNEPNHEKALHNLIRKRFPVIVETTNGKISGIIFKEKSLTTKQIQKVNDYITANLPNLTKEV